MSAPTGAIFKAYDIRGVYPDELEPVMARRIGKALVHYLGAKRVAVGRDMRASSVPLGEALSQGIREAGGRVFDLGLVTTPMTYFAVFRHGLDAGVMVTASHNPARYNGFKICREEAIPVGIASGLAEIRDMALAEDVEVETRRGSLESLDVFEAYKAHVLGFARAFRPLLIAVDSGNGVTGPFVERLLEGTPCRIVGLYMEPDGTFPNHEANPMKAENLADCIRLVRDRGADVGVVFDGDGDRLVLIDETGRPVPSDRITALLGRHAVREQGGGAVVYDLRSSRVVPEEVEAAGGRPIRSRVGHAFIKQVMRANDALVGGELTGHYYFKENHYADSAFIALVEVLSLLAETGLPLSGLVTPLERYVQSGERNYEVKDPDAFVEMLRRAFPDGSQDDLDGLTVTFDDAWFNVRKSNTEPVVRLNMEARTPGRLAEIRSRVEAAAAGEAKPR